MNHSFLRFLFVGLLNTFIGLSVMYMLLHAAHFSYWFSTFSGNFAGACVSYALNRSFTFRSKKSIRHTVYRFFGVIGTCYFLAYFVGIRSAFWVIEKLADLPVIYVEDLAILFGTALYTVLNYIGQKQFVFSH
ncbi:GtrA family protein [Priestia abyssalis]|uniref:GtrA family protein n=1 Tax=Priestia abyssalis TaxID=1221450 RepID=UPI000995244D|nr:GtrA family protein [Priestia abyssalis]